jgi:hypothetical protein
MHGGPVLESNILKTAAVMVALVAPVEVFATDGIDTNGVAGFERVILRAMLRGPNVRRLGC